MKKCHLCGHTNREDSSFCSECGASFADQPYDFGYNWNHTDCFSCNEVSG